VRLGPHSKGDDTRSGAELAPLLAQDPITLHGARIEARAELEQEIAALVAAASQAANGCRPHARSGIPQRFQYVYDFGDGWEHAVVIEKVLPLDPDQQYPVLIAGRRALPCGGVPGYYRLLEVLADPNDEEHAELTEWVGDDFDPERFDADTINAAFAAMARQRRPPGPRARRSAKV
jgi:Plasmid pRiA4b ORF-3-like protein